MWPLVRSDRQPSGLNNQVSQTKMTKKQTGFGTFPVNTGWTNCISPRESSKINCLNLFIGRRSPSYCNRDLTVSDSITWQTHTVMSSIFKRRLHTHDDNRNFYRNLPWSRSHRHMYMWVRYKTRKSNNPCILASLEKNFSCRTSHFTRDWKDRKAVSFLAYKPVHIDVRI